MEDVIKISTEDVEIIDATDYFTDIDEHFSEMPTVAKPLLKSAKETFKKIEQMICSAPAVINTLKASVPQETFQAILTDEQKEKIASGALKLMTKKDGSLMANLVDLKTNKIVSTISLDKVKVTPELSQAMTSYATQMQMAQIAEQIQSIQLAVEEVRQGQEYDRLATAYSCQQKLLQASAMKNPDLRVIALLGIVSDAEDSRNLLMQSQSANVTFISGQPETMWGKLISGAKAEKIDARMIEIRESLCAVNMVSLVEAMAYQEMGEPESARISLQYYADYIKKTYLEPKGLVQRLDMIDPAPENYWSQALPNIEHKIQSLPCNTERKYLGGIDDGESAL